MYCRGKEGNSTFHDEENADEDVSILFIHFITKVMRNDGETGPGMKSTK
jgi:hypothetical protein